MQAFSFSWLGRGVFFVFCCGAALSARAQFTRAQKSIVPVYQAGFHTGFIFAHSTEVQNTAGARPQTYELALARWRNDSLLWNACRCTTLQALSVSYHRYDSDILGQAVSASYLLEPLFRLSPRSSLSLRTVAGLAYLTNPFDAQTNPANQSYSLPVSAYLALGIGYWWKIDDHWQVGAHVLYQHISNGGLRQPNKGINWPTAGLTLNYSVAPRTTTSFARSAAVLAQDIRWDISLFGIAKRVAGQADGRGLRYLVAGAYVQAARQVGRMSNVTGGVEVVWDDAQGSRLRRDLSARDPWRLSVAAGHEFILGRFLFSQQLGVYLYQAGGYFDALYHRWGIYYRFSPHWMAGVNLKAHRHVADFTDIRLTYSF
ncbi:MAG: acyloxyacyl hydrolase [Cyclobacteriaceae bacterium]|jgi:hypothetical protein|nr:acyloxyacyl hydrolase [Cyclobacteriaceae bacterium]